MVGWLKWGKRSRDEREEPAPQAATVRFTPPARAKMLEFLAGKGGPEQLLVRITAEPAAFGAVKDDVVYVRLGGGCQGCAMAAVTLKQGVEQIIRQALPQIRAVVDVTNHGQGDNPYFTSAKGGASPFHASAKG